jgi:hypothetical protein
MARDYLNAFDYYGPIRDETSLAEWLVHYKSKSLVQIPEKRLLFAMIESAVNDIAKNTSRSDHASAVEWVKSDSYRPLSFAYTCDMLDLSVGWMRKLILNGNGNIVFRSKA